MKYEEMRSRMKNTSVKLSTSADSFTLGALLVSVLGFDILLGVNPADYAILGTIGLALIVWLFYRSREKSWNKTA
jgi:hypothetical protein